MKKLLLTLSITCCTAIGFAQSAVDWAKQIGGTQQDFVTDIRYRLVGTTDIFVAVGRFSSSITLSPTITLTTPSVNDTAMFVARFNMAGVCQWAVTAGNANVSTWASAVDIASDGSILVGGILRGTISNTVDFNPGTATTNLTCDGGHDIFVAKYTSAGALSWAFQLGGTQDEAISDIAFDQEAGSTDSEFYIAGAFESLLRFDPAGGNNFRLIPKGTRDVFVGKYKLADGAVTWVNNFGVAGFSQSSAAIKVKGNDLVFNFQPGGDVDMDPGTGTNTNDGLGLYDKANMTFGWSISSFASLFEVGSTGDVFKINGASTDGNIRGISRYSNANGSLIYSKVVAERTGSTTLAVFRLTALTLNTNDDIAISGWYESDYFELNQAGITLGTTKVLPTTTYNQPNRRFLFSAIYDDQANYLQGGLVCSEFISTSPNQPDARLDYLTISRMQFKGNSELFIAGISTENADFFWNNTNPVVATTNAATTGTRDGFLVNFNITPTCVTPTLTTTNAERCGPGTITLTASPSAGIVNWYASATSTTILGTGTSFTTPSISTVTTYFAEAVNGTCVSTRVGALATVRGIPTITGVTGAARCGAGTVTLSATNSGGATSLGWYTTSSGGNALGLNQTFTTPSLSVTTTYYVEAVNVNCISARTAVVATINTTPTISTTPNTRCGTGTVVLGATPSAGTVSWFAASSGGSALATGTSFTTPSISTTTTFHAEATLGTCTSARTAVVATVVANPTITGTPNARCGTGTVVLGATPSAGTVSWYAASSGGSALATGTSYTTPSIASSTTYYAEAVSGTCISPRIAVIATVNSVPTISTTGAARCGSGSVGLGATPSAGTVSWFTSSSGGSALATGNSFTTPSISATTTYFAETNASGCISTRTAAIATINTIPTISTTPNTRCGTGTVVLGATPSAGTVSWFAGSSGGSALATGTSFTTPSISTTTTYYAEATLGTCSSVRSAVIATIAANTTITGTPNARCGTGTVVLGATPTAGTVSWYAASSGGSALATGTSYTTPSIASSTTYYAEAVSGTCISPRIAVIATVNSVPTISTTGAARCGAGSVNLGATPSAGTVSWFAASSGGSALNTGNSFITPGISATTTYFAETNANGCTSTRTAAIATINPVPTITEIPDARCGTGTVTLGATPSAGTVSWFAASSGGSALATGTSFTTPSISTTTTYYAEAVLGTCISTRVPIVATIITSAPTITAVPNARCGVGTVVLGATPSAGTVSWYAASSGGSALATGTSYTTPSIASTTTFYAEAIAGTCSSPRIAVIATVNSVPTISTTGAARCGSGSVNLSATPSAGTVSWFPASSGGSALNTGNSFITPGISATTTYFAETNSNGCTSTRTAAIATVNPVPTITEIPDARCGTGTITLGATPSAGTVSWFAASSGGSALATGTSFTTPSISITTTYFAEAVLGTCISTRVPVVATIITSSPVITAVPNARCGTGTVVLGATPSAGTVSWYAASSGGSALATGTSYTTPSIASTTAFYAEAIAGTCSSPRIAVIATVNAEPTISTTGASRCGAGSVNLGATPSAGTVSWFAASSGGSALNTGNSFITPGISATTTYFAETNANGCTSTRTAAIATINNLPDIDISSIGTTLTVVEAGAVYEWVTCTNQNYSPIVVGITSQQSYEGVDGGEYAVFVTKGGCTDTSNCTLITVSNASEQIMDYIESKVYPNPSSDKVTIELSQDTEVEILDQTGKLVKSIFVNGNQSYTIDNLQAGLYNLKAKNSLKPNLGKILIIK